MVRLEKFFEMQFFFMWDPFLSKISYYWVV